MFEKVVEDLKKSLRDALEKLGVSADEYPTLGIEESKYCDLASSISFKLVKSLKMPPQKIAEEIADNLEISSPLISSFEVKSGYLNFFLSDFCLQETLRRIERENENYGFIGKKGKIILEHTSANPNGPLHIGHARNSAIGDSLRRILQKAGYDVETHYYVNDMGRQMAIVTFGLRRFGLRDLKGDHAIGEIYVRANSEIEKDEKLAEEVDEILRKYEEGDPEVSEELKRAVEIALEGIKETLREMNVHHDVFVWESEFVRRGDVQRVLDELRKRAEVVEEEGALILKLGDEKVVLRRSDGTSLYITRDIAYHLFKASRSDLCIDVLGADHKLISSQLSRILEILGVKPPKVVTFEFVSLPESSMSTRRGLFVSADEVLEKLVEKAYEEVHRRKPEAPEEFKREVSRKVGVGALRYDLVKVMRDKPMVFSWEEALDFEKQGAPYIQYSHARASSILRKSEIRDINEVDLSLLKEPQEVSLIKALGKLPWIVEQICESLNPHLLASYSRDIADLFNDFYRDLPVLKAEREVSEARLHLVLCTKIVLKNSLEMLGIEAPEEM
ncbi:MAG: arginyl-tRNA synthetase [Archaeoglobi archaeon]|nr:arginyl-tRNA synthetase [Archaeoglobi archaeon]MDK2781984.1 arginyl-tRNA synthetase [Archaeoglobi archaeon]